MDITSLAQVAGMVNIAIQAVKGVTKKLPEGKEKGEIEAGLAQAEHQLKLAEVQIASDLKYELCRNHFPPEIMLSADNRSWKCPECDNEIYTGSGAASYL